MKNRVQLGVCLSVGIGLFILIVVALIAVPVYCLKWRKRRISILDQEAGAQEEEEQKDDRKHSVKILHFFWWWKKVDVVDNAQQTSSSVNEENVNDMEMGSSDKKMFVEESIDAELIRLHNLCGPPRFLFTISEETMEELECCEDGESRSRRRRMSDAMVVLDRGPLLLNPTTHLEAGGSEGGFKFNHSLEAEINWLRSSPPPKLKFLRDAEERLLSRLMEEAEKMRLKTVSCSS